MEQQISALYTRFFGVEPASVGPIGGSASNRRYVRLYASDGTSVIGVGCSDLSELRAFCALARSLSAQHIRVPQVLVQEGCCYLQEDLGRTSLFDLIQKCQKSGTWDSATVALLHAVMRDLVDIQFQGLNGFDLGLCCSQQHFSEVNIRWDLNYFKYCFLKGTGVVMDEPRLQREFDRLESELLNVGKECRGFLYRDFQSRNVMVKNTADGFEPWYIDFQGGYEGPCYYDVASFLWQARAAYPEALRHEWLDTYYGRLSEYVTIPREEFDLTLQRYVFFRLLQVLGAYGYRGIFEHKAAFLSPIGQALDMLAQVAPEYQYIHELCAMSAERFRVQETGGLTVRITSFSYKKGIPDDFSGNGGGFVFDCRAPHNPGRYAEYKQLTGLDQPVIDFLEGRDLNPEHQPIGTELTMPQYLEHVYALVDPAVATYLSRGFTSLMVNFGCTGGQHRSVYGAQHLAQHLKALYPDLHIILTHREQGIVQEL